MVDLNALGSNYLVIFSPPHRPLPPPHTPSHPHFHFSPMPPPASPLPLSSPSLARIVLLLIPLLSITLLFFPFPQSHHRIFFIFFLFFLSIIVFFLLLTMFVRFTILFRLISFLRCLFSCHYFSFLPHSFVNLFFVVSYYVVSYVFLFFILLIRPRLPFSFLEILFVKNPFALHYPLWSGSLGGTLQSSSLSCGVSLSISFIYVHVFALHCYPCEGCAAPSTVPCQRNT